MIAQLDPAANTWMTAEETVAVIAALQAAGGKARFVGGSVRNALLGQSVTDIDIATTLKPEDAAAALEKADIDVVPTGIEHGTITAVINGRPFEVTSLRRDVSTDGRRATVAFTNDWAEDAGRRDFTMNAIYADASGRLFDPTGGIADLKAGRVRFVGDAEARIREDYLRILRLFRFFAWYGKDEPDAHALSAAERNSEGLKRLSGERIQKELLRLLEAPDPIPALRAMRERNIIGQILPEPVDLDRLEALVAIARAQGLSVDPILALAALLSSEDAARAVAASLRLSNADRATLTGAVAGALADEAKLDPRMPPREIGRALYRLGYERFCDVLLLNWAAQPEEPQWENLLAAAKGWARPEFPVDGRDAIEAGIPEGPGVGRILSALERWWVDEGFRPDRDALLAKLKELIR